MKKTLVAIAAAAAMISMATAKSDNVLGEKLDSGLGSMVYGEKLDSGLGELTAADLSPYFSAGEQPVAEVSNSVPGEKLDSGLGTMVYGESLDDGLGSMVYGESLDSGLGELTALDLQQYFAPRAIQTASIDR